MFRIKGVQGLFHHLRASVIGAVTPLLGEEICSTRNHRNHRQKLPCTPCQLVCLPLAQPGPDNRSGSGGRKGGPTVGVMKAVSPPCLSSLPLAQNHTHYRARDAVKSTLVPEPYRTESTKATTGERQRVDVSEGSFAICETWCLQQEEQVGSYMRSYLSKQQQYRSDLK